MQGFLYLTVLCGATLEPEAKGNISTINPSLFFLITEFFYFSLNFVPKVGASHVSP